MTDDGDLVKLIAEKAKSGVFLTVLGFGEGNLKDGKLEKLADNGNGMYAYVDSFREARKVLVEQISGSLVTIAKDVKIKVEFNPAEVGAYRLLGYENRLMTSAEFNDDAKDAGEIGAGHTVTALYELVPKKANPKFTTSDGLKYQRVATPTEPPKELTDAAKTGELLTLSLRYKRPDADESTLLESVVKNEQRAFDDASADFRFAASVASFGMHLRNSKHRGSTSFAAIEETAASAIGDDPQGHRTEFCGSGPPGQPTGKQARAMTCSSQRKSSQSSCLDSWHSSPPRSTATQPTTPVSQRRQSFSSVSTSSKLASQCSRDGRPCFSRANHSRVFPLRSFRPYRKPGKPKNLTAAITTSCR